MLSIVAAIGPAIENAYWRAKRAAINAADVSAERGALESAVWYTIVTTVLPAVAAAI